jgi:CopG family nickel-responsive transcriptional regulator
MSELQRIGVAIDGDLLGKFDDLISRRGYTNRSEAFRDLIRADLVNDVAQQPSSRIVGTITLLYDHHVRLLSEKLTSLQHEHHGNILSSLHVHLDHDNCLEVIVLRGRAAEIRTIADRLIAAKGVKHGKLTVTSLGQDI